MAEADLRIVCVPHAGGGANAFRAWVPHLTGVDLVAVALPGRETRAGEPPYIDADALVAAVRKAGDRPYALFGHSMGGLLAVEIARRLQMQGGPLPAQIWLAAAPLPGQRRALTGAWKLPDDELAAKLVRFGGIPAELIREREFLALFLPAIRADLRWLDQYTYVESGGGLRVPVHAVVGTRDTYITATDMAGWASYSRCSFQVHTVEGGHFFPHENAATVCEVVLEHLRRSAVNTGGHDGRQET